MSTMTSRKPSDLVSPNVDSYCWHPDGWESAGWGSVQDARATTRGQAAGVFAREIDHFPDVRVWKRHVRPFTRQDVWDGPGKDRWVDAEENRLMLGMFAVPDLKDLWDGAPATPPTDWQPDEDDGVWGFVHRSHPDAIPVWICGVKGDEPPPSPSAGA